MPVRRAAACISVFVSEGFARIFCVFGSAARLLHSEALCRAENDIILQAALGRLCRPRIADRKDGSARYGKSAVTVERRIVARTCRKDFDGSARDRKRSVRINPVARFGVDMDFPAVYIQRVGIIGKIEATADEREGTKFTVSFPLK